MNTAERPFRIAGRVATAWSGQRLVVLNLDDLAMRQIPTVLDGSAHYLWQLLVEGVGSRSELLERVVADFAEVDTALLMSDLDDFVSGLLGLGLLDEEAAL